MWMPTTISRQDYHNLFNKARNIPILICLRMTTDILFTRSRMNMYITTGTDREYIEFIHT
jgi:hypothetical protein